MHSSDNANSLKIGEILQRGFYLAGTALKDHLVGTGDLGKVMWIPYEIVQTNEWSSCCPFAFCRYL